MTSAGNIVLSGMFVSSLAFGSTTLTPIGNSDVFFTMLDSQGNLLWSNSAGGAAEDIVDSVKADGSGGFYTSGTFTSQQISFGSEQLFNGGQSDIFLTRYDAEGNVSWCRKYGGIGSDGYTAIAIDNLSGDVLISSRCASPNCVVGDITLESPTVFVARVDQGGDTVMAKSIVAPTASTSLVVSSMAVDGNGDFYISGNSLGTFDFEGVVLTHPGIQYGHFLLKYNSQGVVQWGRISGTMNSPYTNYLASNGTDEVFFGGVFISPDLSFDGLTIGNTSEAQDGFLLKVTNLELGLEDINAERGVIYPNPASGVLYLDRLGLADGELYRITDMTGKLISQEIVNENGSIDIDSLANGMYVLTVGEHMFKFLKE